MLSTVSKINRRDQPGSCDERKGEDHPPPLRKRTDWISYYIPMAYRSAETTDVSHIIEDPRNRVGSPSSAGGRVKQMLDYHILKLASERS